MPKDRKPSLPKIIKYDLVDLTSKDGETIVLLFALASNGVLYQSINGTLSPIPFATKAPTREAQQTRPTLAPTDGAQRLT